MPSYYQHVTVVLISAQHLCVFCIFRIFLQKIHKEIGDTQENKVERNTFHIHHVHVLACCITHHNHKVSSNSASRLPVNTELQLLYKHCGFLMLLKLKDLPMTLKTVLTKVFWIWLQLLYIHFVLFEASLLISSLRWKTLYFTVSTFLLLLLAIQINFNISFKMYYMINNVNMLTAKIKRKNMFVRIIFSHYCV